MAFGATVLRKSMDRNKVVPFNSAAPIANPMSEGAVGNTDREQRLNRLRDLTKSASDDRHDQMEQDQSHADKLNAWVEKRCRHAIDTKCQSGVQQRLSEALRFYKGQFSCEELATLPCGAENALWFPLVEFMTRKMHAFLRSTLANEKEHPRFDLRPTSEPDIPPALLDSALDSVEQSILLQIEQGVLVTPTQVKEMVEQMADTLFDEALEQSRYAVKKCKRALDDRLDESDYYKEADKALFDITLYGTEIMYGPFPVLERSATFDDDSNTTWALHKKMQWRALDPLYFFPSVDSTDGQDGEYWTYIDYMTGHDLFTARSCDGWLSDNIDVVLNENEEGYSSLRSGSFADIRALRGQIPANCDMRYEVHWYHGYVVGSMLLEHNVTSVRGDAVVPTGRYDMMIKTCAGLPICIQCPLDPKGKRPLHVAQLFDCPGAFWGRGVYDVLRDQNRIANSAISSLPIDMSYAAQGIFEIDRALLEGDDDMELDAFPGMIVEKDTTQGGLSGDAIKIHQPRSNTGLFISVVNSTIEHAEQLLGLPRYLTGGAQGSGALRTASGLAQLQSNAFVGLEAIIVNIDHGMTSSAMGMFHRMIVDVSDDPDISGDSEVVVMGATAMLARQTHRDQLAGTIQLFLPFAQMGMIPMASLMDLLREVAGSVGVDGRQLIPDQQYEQAKMLEMQTVLQQINPQAIGQQGGGLPGANPQAAGGAIGGAALPGAGGGGGGDPALLAALGAGIGGGQSAPQQGLALQQ